MATWLLWMIAAAVLVVGEVLTLGLVLAPLAGAALLAGVLSLVGLGATVSAVAFVIGSVVLVGFIRPIAVRHRRVPARLRTGTAALVGRRATVLERIANNEGVGCVKLDGEVWTARAYDEDQVIEAGRRVDVLAIRGATALVSE